MNMKLTTIFIAALLFTGFAASQTQETTSTNTPHTQLEATLINSDPVPLQSGESGNINFKIQNRGNREADNVKVELVNHFPYQVKPDRQKNYSLGTMYPGEEYHISTEVLVAEDAPDGSNNFRAKIVTDRLERTVNIPIEVQSENINLNLANLQTEPQQLMPDTDNNVMTVEVVNNGEKTAKSTVIDLNLPEYFERNSSFPTRQSLGNVQPGEVKPATFNFRTSENAPSGMTNIEGEMTYTAGDSSSEVTEDINFDVHLEGKPQFEVREIENRLLTGSTNELRLEIENTGDKKSSSTRIRALEASDQPFSYESSSQYIGTLEPGQTGTAVFNIDTDSGASVKDYLIDFETRGVKDTEVFVKDTTIQVDVSEGEESLLPLIIAAIALLAVLATGYLSRNKIRRKLRRE